MFGDGGRVLAVERPGEQLASLAGEARLVEQGGGEGGKRQVEAQAGEAQAQQGFRADQNNLGVGRGTVCADEFDAGLRHLPVRCPAGRAHVCTGLSRRGAAGEGRLRGAWRRCGQSAA